MFSRDQYDAAHRSAVVSDRSSRGTIVLSGSDRRSFLHALLTNDITTLTKGSGTYAAYLTPQGRMIADMRVFETGDQILMSVERFLASALTQRLDALVFSEDVQVKDVSAELDEVSVHGPLASRVIERATAINVAELKGDYSNLVLNATLANRRSLLTVVRDDTLGVDGFSIYLPKGEGEWLRQQLIQAGAAIASDLTLEALRIEAGRPRFGIDMSTDTIPLEAGIENRAISFTKGCYVGQEVIIRVMHRGHGRVARRLVRLVVSTTVPNRGDKIFAGDQLVGEITSATESPKARAPLAMGYVHRDYAARGTELRVNGSEARVDQPAN